jgi:hypothetical protein
MTRPLREPRERPIDDPRVPRAYEAACSARACTKSLALGQKAGALADDFPALASQSWHTSSALQNWQVRIAELKSRPKRLRERVGVQSQPIHHLGHVPRPAVSLIEREHRILLGEVN